MNFLPRILVGVLRPGGRNLGHIARSGHAARRLRFFSPYPKSGLPDFGTIGA
jgi:hypothetical protein